MLNTRFKKGFVKGMNKKILYVKNSSSKFNLNTYNVQAIGLGKAFCQLGFDFDFLFFSKKDEIVSMQQIAGKTLQIISKRGIRILRSFFCAEILEQEFLKQYDFVITTEYGQMMTYFLSKTSDNVAMYSGPYYNLFKFPFISPLYDLLFTKSINENVRCKFVKSVLAKEYLENKGYSNVINVGVALDIERFDIDVEMKPETQQVVDFMTKNRCILYVGAMSNRKNYPFMLEIYRRLLKEKSDIKFVMIGKGDSKYVEKYMRNLSDKEKSGIYRVPQIDNAQLKYIYPLAKAFLLPSRLEIFGMVLLEAMYLGAPVITSRNGGSTTLIEGKKTGTIIPEFEVEKWVEAIINYIDNDSLTLETTKKARQLILNEYNWFAIAEKMLNYIRDELDV